MINVPIAVYNRVGTNVTPIGHTGIPTPAITAFAIPLDNFAFIGQFYSGGPGSAASISDKKVVWNFGDGTISSQLTGTHYYTYPGNYNVTLTVFESGGDGILSSNVIQFVVYNFICDALILTTNATLTLTSGNINEPIFLTRYNSWSTSNLSIAPVINLSVSGNIAPFFDANVYYNDQWAHLKSTARFVLSTVEGFTVVNTLTTTNDPIFVTLSSSNTFYTSPTSAYNSFLAGTSGVSTFYYVEDFV